MNPYFFFNYDSFLNRPFLAFPVISNVNTIFKQQINVEESSIQRWDLNSRSLGHESPPLTTRPGLPSFMVVTQRKHCTKITSATVQYNDGFSNGLK